jgi:hypothetical protein
VKLRIVAVVLAFAAAASAQTALLPLQSVKAGMRGVGKTVFSGNNIEEFQVEILGVLENIGPKQSLILARLSGGPLAKTGVLQGMSGSPVYIDGKLVGAVAMAFPFSTEPIAGIRPIEEMLRVGNAPGPALQRAALSPAGADLSRLLPQREEVLSGDARMIDIATPVSFGGFTRGAIERFAPQLHALGLEPRQGVSGGGRVNPRMGDRAALKPGSMISVQLMTGDMSIGADGTVTAIEGDMVYAFGHRFLAIGPTGLPFARSEVMTLLPNLNSSFKISSPRELMGVIRQDRNTAIAGELGKRAELAPVNITVARAGRKVDGYQMEIVNDRYLTPFLMQMALYSAIDSTERTLGAASYTVRGQIEFQGSVAPLKLNNVFAGDANTAIQVSLSAAIPLAYVLQSGFHALDVKRVELQIDSFDEKKLMQIDQVLVSPREVRPGGKVEVTAVLAGENGSELTRKVTYTVPVGAEAGPLYFTVADGMSTNVAEFRQIALGSPKSPEQLVAAVNKLRTNNKAYVRVWRAEPDFQMDADDLPDPPPSAALILATSPSALQTRNSKVTELEITAGDIVISGGKTVQVEVKE